MSAVSTEKILTALSIGEDSDWEFKSAKGGIPRSLWETYSAMANTDGGTIVLGVKETDNVFDVQGLENPEQMQKIIWDTVNNRGKVSTNLLSNGDVEIRSIGECKVLVIRIPRAGRRQRPVFIGQNPLVGTFRRNYEGDYHCTQDEVGRMLADQAEEPADSRVLEHFSISDLDEETIKQYRQRFSARSPDHAWLSLEIPSFLEKLGAWRKERSTGREGITVAGLLMFGKAEAIRDPEAIPSYHVDYREKLSADPAVRWSDRLTIDGMWAGNIFLFYTRVMGKLAHDFKIPFQFGPDLFRRDDTAVHESIRESLVNALIHADYRGQGGIVIERYSDRIMMSNPGILLISREQLLYGGVSECRNKTLQTMFQLIGGGEKAGSGIDRIRAGWSSQHWRSPNFRETSKPDRIVLMLPMMSIIPATSLERLQKQFGVAFARLNKEEVQALVTADVEKYVTNARMQEITGKHSSDITFILKRLTNNHFLIQHGKARWTTYSLPDITEKSSIQSSESSIQSSGSSIQSSASSIQSSASSIQSSGNEGVDPTQDEILLKIARPAREKPWLRRLIMSNIIRELCRNRFLTIDQIAKLTQRSVISIRNQYVRPMIKECVLELRYPERPNHPGQAYRLLERIKNDT